MKAQPRSILDGVKVLDLTSGIAGPLAALQLSEAGAEVVRIESETIDPASALDAVLNRGKTRIALSLDDPAFGRLLAGADILLHELTPKEALRLGLDDGSLARRFPTLIVSAITGWPAAHSRAEAPARETLVLAALGLLDEQPGHRPGPIFVRMPFASWTAGWLAAIAILARLIARQRDGIGGAAHTSLAQAALVPMTMHWTRAETPSPVFAKGLSKDIPIPLHQAADGQWIHVHYSPDKAPWMAEGLEEMGAETVAAANALFPPSHVAPNYGANKAIIAKRPAADWVRHFWEHDVAAQIAAPFGEIYADPQARVNGFAVTVEDPALGSTVQPGVPYSIDPPSRVRGGRQPLSSAEAIGARWQTAPVVPATTPTGKPPLAGLKVLDLGAYLAGPFAAMLLADLGADVVKVEPPAGDAMRRLERQFTGIQRGKRGLALKLGHPAAREPVAALARWADIVHHNIRRPAARKLGVDYATLGAENPALVYCHVSSYGPLGDRADWPGFDQLFQAACGWETEDGGEGNPPLWLRFGIVDFLASLASVFATLLALIERERSGLGQAVAASLLGGAMLTMAEAVMRPDSTLTEIQHLDHDQMGVAPEHRLYRTRDLMVAVAALAAEEKEAFNARVGADPEAWFAARSAKQAKAELDAAQVPAERVREAQMEPFLDWPDNERAGLHAAYRHRDYGEIRQIGGFWNFGDLPLTLDRAAPGLGEHSQEVLEMVGLGDSFDPLVRAGVSI
ncbi:MAG: CoA transferase [Alphaproteobacteria bacterium]|nr:CoA transferase [Alphaproteobacteria bacterium]